MHRRSFLALIPSAALAQRNSKVQNRERQAAPTRPPAAAAASSDWTQWRGPNRSNMSPDTGLLKEWPSGGPKLIWTATGIGKGYGSVAVVGDRVYVQGTKGGQSAVYAVDRGTGRLVWNAPLGRMLDQDRGDGPRATPTVEGDRVYALSEGGDLACINAGNAHILWSQNVLDKFGASNPHWLISESPLLDGNNLIVTPGGSGAGMVALEKTSGNEVWRCRDLSDGAGYSSAIVADVQGVRTIMNLTSRAGVGVRATDGKLMWRYEPVANRVANCTTPLYHQDKVFYTSAYGTGCALLDLKPQGGEVKANEVYFNRDMMNHHGGVVLVNGFLYGFSNAILTCMEWNTGRVAWRDRSVGKGSLTFADGMLYLLGEAQTVGLAEATPDGYREKSRFRIEDKGLPSWAHPVVIGGRLYIRNQDTLTCYQVA